MAKLQFDVTAKWQEVEKLRQEVEALKVALKDFNVSGDMKGFDEMNKKYAEATGKLKEYEQQMQRYQQIIEQMKLSTGIVDDSKRITAELDNTTDSFLRQKEEVDSLNNKIKDLRKEYKNLSDEDKASSSGQEKLAEIRATIVARDKEKLVLQQLQREYTNNIKINEAAEDSLVSLRAQLSNLTAAFDRLSSAERNAEVGENLIKQIEELQKVIREAEQATGRFQRNVGNYPQLDGLKDTLTDILGLNNQLSQSILALSENTGFSLESLKGGFAALGTALKGLMANPAFLTLAGISGAFAAAKSWYDYNKGIQEATKLTKQFTGLSGEELKSVRTDIQELADFYNKDFRETLVAVNSLSKQFGISQSQASELVKDGFLSGADASGEYLDILREYPAYFKEAGLSAENFIAIVSQAGTSGVFSDKAVDTIKEANLRIREMTDATAEALNKIGLDSKKIQEELTSGQKTTFDIIQEISRQLSKLPEASSKVGAVLADVFGGPGEDAGLQFILSLKDISLSIDEVKDKAGELAEAEEKLLEAQSRLSKEIALIFDMTGGSFEELSTKIGTFFRNTAADVLKFFRESFSSIETLSRQGIEQAKTTGIQSVNREVLEQEYQEIEKYKNLYIQSGKEETDAFEQAKEDRIKILQSELEEERDILEKRRQENIAFNEELKNASFWRQGLGLDRSDMAINEDIASSWDRYIEQLTKVNALNQKIVKLQGYSNLKTEEPEEIETEEDIKARKKAEEKAKKEAEKQKKIQAKVNNELLELQRRNQQAQIDLMEEGSEKKLAQINLDYDNAIAEIRKREQEWRDAQGGQLTEEQTKEIRTAYVNEYVKKMRSEQQVETDEFEESRKAMNEYLVEYGTFQQKKLAINEKYTRLIAEAATEGEKLSLGKEWDKELTDLEIKAGDTSNAIIALFGDMSDKSLKELEGLAAKGQEAIEFIKNGQWDATTGARLGITEDEFRRWQESPEVIKQAGDALKEVKAQADELQPAFVAITRGFQNFVNAGNDSSLVAKALEEIQYGLDKLNPAVNLLSDSFSKLSDSFGGVFSGISEGLNVAMDAVSSGMQGAQAAVSLGLGGIGAAAGAAIGVVSSLASAIARIHDKKNEKRIQKLQEQIDVLDASYDKFGRSIEKAYSTDASNLIEQQNEVLERQKLIIQQQIREEEDKKKTDEERIKQWEQQIADIDATIADNAEKAQEYIAGISFETFRNNFLDTLMDMDSTAEDFANDFESYLQRSILDSLMASKYDEKIKQLYNQWTQLGDNGLTESEVEKLRKEQQAIVEQMIQDRDNLAEIFGWKSELEESAASSQQASAGGFENMSQDSADELNGRFTALQMAGEELLLLSQERNAQMLMISASMETLRDSFSYASNIVEEIRNRQVESLIELQQINDNTLAVVKPIQQMQRDIAAVRDNTSRI